MNMVPQDENSCFLLQCVGCALVAQLITSFDIKLSALIVCLFVWV